MDNILDDESLLDEKDLLKTIWTKPTPTLEFILKNCPRKYVNYLLILGGVVNAVGRSYQRLTEHSNYSVINFIVIVFFGGIIGWIISNIYAMLLSWTGKWLKGKADMDQFLTVLAWATIPFICSLVPMILRLLIFGNDYFDFREQNIPIIIIYSSLMLIQLSLSIWTLVITIKGIALIQNFDSKKATLNAFMPLFVIMIPILIIVGIIYLVH